MNHSKTSLPESRPPAIRTASLRAPAFLLALLLMLMAGASSLLRAQTSCSPECLTNSLSMNTGVNHTTQQLYNIGNGDGYWRIVQDPQGGTVPRCANVIDPSHDWYTPGGSRWLGPNLTSSVPTPGIYIYEWCFCVCMEGMYNINMLVGCDDEGEVYLDGVLLGSILNYGADFPTNISTSRALAPGKHCIQVRVDNSGGVFSGMNLEGSITTPIGTGLAKHNCCEAPLDCPSMGFDTCRTNSISINTGVNHGVPQLYDIGDGDAYWHLLSDPQGGNVPRCPYVIEASPDWYTPSGNSQWIGPNLTASVTTNGQYNYKLCFCVKTTGTYTINMTVGSDDASDITLDGRLIRRIPSTSAQNPVTFSVTVTLTAGQHCLGANVFNTGSRYSGLNVEGTITSVSAPFGLSRYNCCDSRLDCSELCRANGALSVNTGTNHSLPGLYNIGDSDPYWQIIQDPQGKPVPRCANVITRSNDWYTASATSQWIGPNPTADVNVNGVYIYQLCFCVENPGWFDLNFGVGGDDEAKVYLDGTIYIGTAVQYGADIAPTWMTANKYLTAGQHCIQVKVENKSGKFSGMNMEGTITPTGTGTLLQYRCCDSRITCFDPCEADYYSLSTGYDPIASSTFSVGDDDPYWQVITDPNDEYVPRCADVIAPAYSWPSPDPNSQWIGTTPTADNPTNGIYRYQRCFCVAETGEVTIDITVRADDAATILLDGTPIGSNSGVHFPTHIVHTVTLTAGKHCIQIDVENINSVHSGLNVAGGVTGDGLQHFGCCDDRLQCYNDDDGPINIEQGDLSGVSGTDDGTTGEAMLRSIPNPTSGSTTIHYVVANESIVSIDLYNTAGQKISTLLQEKKEAGAHTLSYDAKALPAGTYYLRLTSGEKVVTVPMQVQ